MHVKCKSASGVVCHRSEYFIVKRRLYVTDESYAVGHIGFLCDSVSERKTNRYMVGIDKANKARG